LDVLGLTGTHQPVVCPDEDNLLGEKISGIKKNTEPLLVGGMDTDLVVNAERNITVFRHQNAEQPKMWQY
jgi:hypothetical protein